MASKETPKKLYQKQSGLTITSRCRLCNSVASPQHSKNLFRHSNRATLRSADVIFGGELTKDSKLPHLICRPCERRLKNFNEFKGVITETQRLLRQDVGSKRCIDLSPSVAKPSAKVRAAGSTRRRSIDFGEAGKSGDESQNIQLQVSIVYVLSSSFFQFNMFTAKFNISLVLGIICAAK